MTRISPSQDEKISMMRSELRLGLMINIEEGSFAAIEHITASRFEGLQAQGEVWVILSKQRALDLQMSYDPSRDVSLKLPRDYSFELLKALADPSLDLDYPGKGPLPQGQIPDAICANILGFCKKARSLPAAVFVKARVDGAKQITDEDWSRIHSQTPQLRSVTQARVPLMRAPHSQLHVFQDVTSDEEHYAVVIGGALDAAPLVRLHSACFTGDCLGSLKCDCGPQLDSALETLGHEGGVLLYLSQEGRGIGLPNKMRAYRLQDQGFDTVEANLKLGFEDDERDFRIGAELLKRLKIKQVRLMTNNPSKIQWLEASGIKVVERVAIKTPERPENAHYLATKATKSGHLL